MDNIFKLAAALRENLDAAVKTCREGIGSMSEAKIEGVIKAVSSTGMHSSKQSSFSRNVRLLGKKLSVFYDGSATGVAFKSNKYAYVNWNTSGWESMIQEWPQHHKTTQNKICKFSYTNELIRSGLSLAEYCGNTNMKKETQAVLEQAFITSKDNAGVIVEDTAQIISEENMKKILLHLHTTPTLENLVAASLITFHCIFRTRTGYQSVLSVKEKDLCLSDGYIHFSPPVTYIFLPQFLKLKTRPP